MGKPFLFLTENCIRDLHKKVNDQKKCIRLSVLECLYLECMEKEEVKKVSDKELCDGRCENHQDCRCQFCVCFSVCKSQCFCRNFVFFVDLNISVHKYQHHTLVSQP